jgi:Uma2 family endonuclease
LLGEIKNPCQLINGELIISPAPSPQHQRVLRKLFKVIDAANLPGEIFFSPIDLYIDSENVFQPDLVYLSPEHLTSVTEKGIEDAPDLVVEIIFPPNSYTDRNQKKKKYLELRVPEYWIVDPGNKTIEIYTPQTGPDVPAVYLSAGGIVRSAGISSLQFDLSELF